jgi:hypothetical protein
VTVATVAVVMKDGVVWEVSSGDVHAEVVGARYRGIADVYMRCPTLVARDFDLLVADRPEGLSSSRTMSMTTTGSRI